MSGPSKSAGTGGASTISGDEHEVPAPDIRIEGGTILAIGDGTEFAEIGFVDIVGNQVAAVGPLEDRPPTRPERLIDATGSVVLPGLVDAHTHLFQVAARGLGDGLSLADWLRNHMIPLSLELRAEESVALSELGALHSLRSGTVAAINHHYGGRREAEDVVAVAHAMERVGMAGAVARVMIGEQTDAARAFEIPPANHIYTNAQEIELTETAMREKSDGPVAVWPGPGNAAYCSDELLGASAELALRCGVRWHTHAAEDSFSVDVTRRCRAGRRTFHVLAAHHRPHVVYNPISYAFLGSGIMRLTDLRSGDVPLAAGSDGCAVAGQDMFEVARLGALLQRARLTDSAAVSVRDMLRLIAGGGARALRSGIGTIAPGQPADLIVVDTSSLHHEPINDPWATVGWFANGPDVSTVIARGAVVLDD
ncbi:MAG: amidohydrolase family protein, partial [Acidimicrobiia bacterium]|nr:amidohydrolase family protein [Acidimicrobiia bacterium]